MVCHISRPAHGTRAFGYLRIHVTFAFMFPSHSYRISTLTPICNLRCAEFRVDMIIEKMITARHIALHVCPVRCYVVKLPCVEWGWMRLVIQPCFWISGFGSFCCWFAFEVVGESKREGRGGRGVKLVGWVGRREINETKMNESDQVIRVWHVIEWCVIEWWVMTCDRVMRHPCDAWQIIIQSSWWWQLLSLTLCMMHT